MPSDPSLVISDTAFTTDGDALTSAVAEGITWKNSIREDRLCLQIGTNDKWHHVKCTTKSHYVCETYDNMWLPSSSPSPSPSAISSSVTPSSTDITAATATASVNYFPSTSSTTTSSSSSSSSSSTTVVRQFRRTHYSYGDDLSQDLVDRVALCGLRCAVDPSGCASFSVSLDNACTAYDLGHLVGYSLE